MRNVSLVCYPWGYREFPKVSDIIHDVVKAAGSRDTDGSQEGQEGFDMYFRWHCHIGIIMGITSFLN